MPSYKLSYFDITALGEPIRFLLSYGKADFVDNRVQKEQWPALKSSMPFGQMPVLEIDGKQTHQSVAICRYLAKQFGLAGANDWESLQIDIVADTFNDLRQKIGAAHYEADEKLKETKYETVVKETLPFYLPKLDAIAKENNGYLANGKLSWADLFFVGLLDYVNMMARLDITEKYPNLQQVKKNVLAVPQIKDWVDKRPKTI